MLSSWTTRSAVAAFFVIPKTTAEALDLLGKLKIFHPATTIYLLLFFSFENRDVCEEIIRKFHGQPIGEEGLLLQVRYADTPAQKDLKRITTERRQFRTNEYNVGAYGAPAADMIALASPPMPSPILPRASQIARHLPGSRSSGSWKRDGIPRYAIPL